MSGAPDTPVSGPAAPLEGLCVLVTRARHQAAALADPLTALGAKVLVAPVIDTVDPADWTPVDEAIARLADYDWIVFTSANAVERFVFRMGERGVPARELDGARTAVVGPATAERLEAYGITPGLVPDDYRAEGLVDEFRARGVGSGRRVLVPRAERAREILPDALREAGATVDVVPVYRTVPAMPEPGVVDRLRAGDVDIVTFTSPSTAKHFIAWIEAANLDAGAVMARIAAASIGPVTTQALRRRGYAVPIEADSSTVGGLVEAIAEYRAAARPTDA